MKIGLISDTHDNLPLIRRAVEFFNGKKVDFVLHAGDFIAPFSLEPFQNLKASWRGVFGNNDGEKEGLFRKSSGKIVEAPLFLEFDSRKVALMHQFEELEADILIYGHSHIPQMKKTRGFLIVNPGEASGWLYGNPTVGILDTRNLSCEIFSL